MSDQAEIYEKFAKQSENNARIQNAVKLLMTDPAIRISAKALDRDPYQLGTPSGVVDLRSGLVTPGNRGALITKSTTAKVGDPEQAKRWRRFLSEAFSDEQEIIEYLKRVLGLSLIGKQLEHLLLVLYGSGANGKSVFIDTVAKILGEYASPLPDGLLTSSKWDRHPTEIASLLGMRLCFAEETSHRARLDEAKLKRLTGGSELTARFMQQDFFKFSPSHTLFLVTNYKPEIKGADNGIWRRIKEVDFGPTVPEEKRDPNLKDKLLEEQDHILAWMIEGCVEYLQGGLREPSQVREWTEGYQRESDPFRQFVEENLVSEPGAFLATSDILQRHDAWFRDGGAPEVVNLARRLTAEYGDCRTNRDGKRGYKGLALAPDPCFDVCP